MDRHGLGRPDPAGASLADKYRHKVTPQYAPPSFNDSVLTRANTTVTGGINNLLTPGEYRRLPSPKEAREAVAHQPALDRRVNGVPPAPRLDATAGQRHTVSQTQPRAQEQQSRAAVPPQARPPARSEDMPSAARGHLRHQLSSQATSATVREDLERSLVMAERQDRESAGASRARDSVWQEIAEAKDDVLRAKEAALENLRKDLARQQETLARLSQRVRPSTSLLMAKAPERPPISARDLQPAFGNRYEEPQHEDQQILHSTRMDSASPEREDSRDNDFDEPRSRSHQSHAQERGYLSRAPEHAERRQTAPGDRRDQRNHNQDDRYQELMFDDLEPQDRRGRRPTSSPDAHELWQQHPSSNGARAEREREERANQLLLQQEQELHLRELDRDPAAGRSWASARPILPEAEDREAAEDEESAERRFYELREQERDREYREEQGGSGDSMDYPEASRPAPSFAQNRDFAHQQPRTDEAPKRISTTERQTHLQGLDAELADALSGTRAILTQGTNEDKQRRAHLDETSHSHGHAKRELFGVGAGAGAPLASDRSGAGPATQAPSHAPLRSANTSASTSGKPKGKSAAPPPASDNAWMRAAEAHEEEAVTLRQQVEALLRDLEAARALLEESELRREAAEDLAHTVQAREEGYLQDVDAWRREAQSLRGNLQERDERISVIEQNERQYNEATMRVQSLERYLKEVPTSEEFQEKCDQVGELEREAAILREENAKMLDQLQVLSRKVTTGEQDHGSMVKEIEELRVQVLALDRAKTETSHELKQLIQRLSAERDAIKQSYDAMSRELSETHAECEKLQQRIVDDRAVQSHEQSRHAQREGMISDLQAKVAEHVAVYREYDDKITEYDENHNNTMKKVKAQASTIRELRECIDTLTEHNQRLIAEVQNVRRGGELNVDDILAPQLPVSYMTPTETDLLQDALARCVEEFKSVLQLAITRIHGSDPQIGHLLGLGPGPDAKLFVRTSDFDSRLESVKEMLDEIENVRDTITQKYASDVGKDACAVQ